MVLSQSVIETLQLKCYIYVVLSRLYTSVLYVIYVVLFNLFTGC